MCPETDYEKGKKVSLERPLLLSSNWIKILNIFCLIEISREKLIDSSLGEDRTGLVIAAIRLVGLSLATELVTARPLRGQQAVAVSASLASATAPAMLVVIVQSELEREGPNSFRRCKV